ncbi:hypothetical protein DTO164E3_3018 [Paecilomyces variotii]|nr:hypothetical protein DTO032I3_4617 [Paecilomyces variotii]KAJ9202578.1 hypothetical protein DTO164E3_3018 [Paecilomyces variotii]KAJ9283033.1 hypothetical protein DTO021D3_370 [Paecilomyces variotii]KAJ9343770.1 hypothetical protein DTO027B6_3595 [Paecilomyces variotii]KAJ9366793.1 hypothetical protein DTO282E5_8534 [Paecilomyces variotii]
MPRGSGRTEIPASQRKPKNPRTEPKRDTVKKSTYCYSRQNIIQRMGRSILRGGYRIARKQWLDRCSRVSDMAITQEEYPDTDVIMEDAPMLAHTVSSLAQVADDYDWNIVVEELCYMMAALTIASHTEEAPEPQYIELVRRPPPISRLPTTPRQEKEIRLYLDQIAYSRDVKKAKERRSRHKVAHLGSLMDGTVQRLRNAGISDEEIFDDVDERAEEEDGRIEYCVNDVYHHKTSAHVQHVEDVRSQQQSEIIYYCKPRDPTENITPKRIDPSAQCPLPAIWKDHLLAAHIPMRMKCKESTPLFKQIMTKKLHDSAYTDSWKVIDCRDRVFGGV